MQINWEQTLEGVPLTKIRASLKQIGGRPFTADSIAHKAGADMSIAGKLASGLVASRLISPCSGHPDHYEITELTLSLCLAKKRKPITREQADAIVAAVIAKCYEVNTDAACSHEVDELYVYGSYIGDAPVINDLDMAANIRGKWDPTTNEMEEMLATFYEAHPEIRCRSSMERFSKPVEYVRRKLNVHSHLDLHDAIDLKHLGCPRRQLLPAVADIPAREGWSKPERNIILVQADGPLASSASSSR